MERRRKLRKGGRKQLNGRIKREELTRESDGLGERKDERETNKTRGDKGKQKRKDIRTTKRRGPGEEQRSIRERVRELRREIKDWKLV